MNWTRRKFLKVATGATVGVSLSALTRPKGAQPKRPKRPNILFIITDQQRKDAMGAYGNTILRTPNMDRIAREGIRFENFFIASFPCSPSRASFLTGLHHHSHGVISNNLVLNPKLPNLGQLLSDAGYHTAWMGKWHLAGPDKLIYDERGIPIGRKRASASEFTPPEKLGFETVVSAGRDYLRYLRRLGLEEPLPGKKVRGGHHTVIQDGHSVIPEEHCVEAFLAKEAVKFIHAQRNSERPFFLGLSFPGPHRPMTPPEPWDKIYSPDDMVLPANHRDDMSNKPAVTQRRFRWFMLRKGLNPASLKRALVFENEMWDLLDRGHFGEREFKELMAHYYGFISYIDKWTGYVLDALDELGLTDNTVVIFTTDHGEMMGSHGCIFKGLMMYDELMNIPFLMRYPPLIRPGRVTYALVSSIDLMPTLLELANVPIPNEVQGRSFLPVLDGVTEEHRNAVFSAVTSSLFSVQICMVRTKRWKYCLNWKPRQVDELYDLRRDPGELRNLASDPAYKGIVDNMQARLFQWMRETDYPWREEARIAAKTPRVPVTSINFTFERLWEGYAWTAHRGIVGLRIRDSKLVGEISCPGYIVCELDTPVAADDYPVLLLRMRTTAGVMAQFYWATADSPQFDERKSVKFPIRSDGEFHTYRIELHRHPLWAGKQITAIRLNPIRRTKADKRELKGAFEIDELRGAKVK